jgi:hypothetical protein
MRLTHKKLKQLIIETMYAPSTIIDDALDDPDVHPKIKDLLSTDSDEDKRTGLAMLDSMYPDKYSQGAVDHLHLGSDEYKDTFKKSSLRATIGSVMEDFYAQSNFANRLLTAKPWYYDEDKDTMLYRAFTNAKDEENLRQLHRFNLFLMNKGYEAWPMGTSYNNWTLTFWAE